MSILIGNSDYSPVYAYLDCNQKNKILDDIKKTIETISNVKVEKIEEKGKEILWVRDIFVIIDNICLICNLTKLDTISKDRSKEYRQVVKYILENTTYRIRYLPHHVNLEGGDIIQNNNDIFVGINERTTINAYVFLKNLFPRRNFIPILHKDLHLDCVISVLKNNTIIYSEKRILNENATMYLKSLKNYNVLNIDTEKETDDKLFTNFIIIGNNILHSSRICNTNVYNILENLGYDVHVVDIDDLWKEGGCIRCLTQWIIYPESQCIK